MTFKDYFSKTFETSDNHHIQTLKTHYYRCRKEDVVDAAIQVINKMGAIITDQNLDRGEIIVDASDFSGTITITATSFTEIALDISVITYNFLPTAKGKKVIEKFYELTDKVIPLKGVGLHASF